MHTCFNLTRYNHICNGTQMLIMQSFIYTQRHFQSFVFINPNVLKEYTHISTNTYTYKSRIHKRTNTQARMHILITHMHGVCRYKHKLCIISYSQNAISYSKKMHLTCIKDIDYIYRNQISVHLNVKSNKYQTLVM